MSSKGGKRARAESAEGVVVEGAPRSSRGKNEARRLRQTGQVPAVLYGGKGGPVTLSVNAKQVSAILRSPSGHNRSEERRVGNEWKSRRGPEDQKEKTDNTHVEIQV